MASKENLGIVPIQIQSWDDFLGRVRSEDGWIYRGQQDATWPLSTSLERTEIPPEERETVEGDLLFRFKQAINNYLPLAKWPKNRLDWLASMQHHGAPTRLLDFTRSPYVAAYFAVENVPRDAACAVWAIRESWCTAGAAHRLQRPLPEVPVAFPELFRWLYESDHGWKSIDAVAPAGPREVSERHVAQQALFVASGNLRRSFAENLESTAHQHFTVADNVRCFRIPGSLRTQALGELRLMNISRASLFPGLDGFAQSLRYSLVREDPYEKALRAAILEQLERPSPRGQD